jgi:hypothetical protein
MSWWGRMSLLLAVRGEDAKANTSGHGYREAGPEGRVPRQGMVPTRSRTNPVTSVRG